MILDFKMFEPCCSHLMMLNYPKHLKVVLAKILQLIRVHALYHIFSLWHWRIISQVDEFLHLILVLQFYIKFTHTPEEVSGNMIKPIACELTRMNTQHSYPPHYFSKKYKSLHEMLNHILNSVKLNCCKGRDHKL